MNVIILSPEVHLFHTILTQCVQEMKILFSDVNDSKETWTVHAKVLRKWVVRRKAAPYAVWKIGMILVDEEVYTHFNFYVMTLFSSDLLTSLYNIYMFD